MFRVLVLSKNNAVLGPMAEGYFRKFSGDDIEVYSAGTALGKIDPLVIGLMKEDGIDISGLIQHRIEEYRHIDFDFILTCDEESDAISHHLPSKSVKYHFDFHKMIPGQLTRSEKVEVYKKVRDRIKRSMHKFITDHFVDDK